MKRVIVIYSRDDRDLVALMTGGGSFISRGQLMVIGQVSQRTHPKVHSLRIWGPRGPDPPAFPIFRRDMDRSRVFGLLPQRSCPQERVLRH